MNEVNITNSAFAKIDHHTPATLTLQLAIIRATLLLL